MTLYIVGFDDLVTSFVATIATAAGASPCRVGLPPTGKPRLYASRSVAPGSCDSPGRATISGVLTHAISAAAELARMRPCGPEGPSRPLSPDCAEQRWRQPRPWLDQATVSGPHLPHGDRSQTCCSTNRQLCQTNRRAEYDLRTASCPR